MITKRPFAAAILAALVAVSCRNVDVVTASYATLAEARAADVMAKGYLPDGLPPGARDIREAHTAVAPPLGDLQLSARRGHLAALLEPSELSLEGQSATCPAGSNGGLSSCTNRLDAERTTPPAWSPTRRGAATCSMP
jgi:hypothetical protein